MRRLLTVLGTLVAMVGVMSVTAMADNHFLDAAFSAQLAGENEVPAVDTAGSGYASVTVSEDGSSLDYRLYVNDLDDVTMAHIHVGAEEENGPVVAFLFGPEEGGVMADGLLAEGTITEADLIPVEGTFDGTMDQLIELIRSGETYVNVHTTTNPAGEIRGQLHLSAFNFQASLAGANEVPPVDTDASGVAAFSVNDSQTEVEYKLITHGLVDAVQAHIHIGPSGVNGPVVVFLFGPEEGGVTQDGILSQGSFTEAELLTVEGTFDGTMQTLLDHLRAGTAYVNVHTVANPPGEIRGQVDGLDRSAVDFTDDDSSVHEANIELIAAADITRGCNPPENDQFCPDEELTRGQGAAFFARAFNLGEASDDFFEDDENSIFEADINTIAEARITVGCNPPENTEFCPGDSVTRAQWASFMVRALGLTEGGDDDLFEDDEGSVHEQDINRIATAGITLGCNPPENDEFCPDATVNRAQAASFFARAMGWRTIDS